MDERAILVMLLFALIGWYSVFFGWEYRAGKNKKPLFATNGRYAYYGIMGIPFGIFSFSLSAGMFMGIFLPESQFISTLSTVFLYIGFGACFIGWLASFFRKSFMYPDWVKQFERKHEDVMHHLRANALEMGIDVWAEKVKTQEAFEEWISEVREKVKMSRKYY